MSDTLKFTAMQLAVLLVVYAVTWAGIYGMAPCMGTLHSSPLISAT